MRWRGPAKPHFPPVVLAVCLLFVGGIAAAKPLETMRDDYSDAIVAIDRGQWTEYQKLRSGLDNYPLAIYLDYYHLTGKPERVGPDEARAFMDESGGTPLRNRFLASYLNTAGRKGRWNDFLAVFPKEPRTLELKCYYFRARLANGDTEEAWSGARSLWVHGKSRPDECDPLFAAWMKAGQLDDEAVWERMLATVDTRKGSLMRYVSRKATPALESCSDQLIALYRRPDRLVSNAPDPKEDCAADIVAAILPHLARDDSAAALEAWLALDGRYTFDEEQRSNIAYKIAWHSLVDREDANRDWLDQVLPQLESDTLVEIRLRWALAELDWAAVQSNLTLLSDKKSTDSGWRYWRAVAALERGATEQAELIFQSLATERGYYSWLAADRLGQDYQFNNRPLVLASEQLQPLKKRPGVRRVEELYYHDKQSLAHSEWNQLLLSSPRQELEPLAWIASEQGWHRLSIDAANKAAASDWLAMRFPLAYQDTFSHYALAHGVPDTELMAIARRESAFLADARSSVGARGLMQVMPATGKQVARALGEPFDSGDLYEIEPNVLLGSAYYKQLLEQFDGNRIFALAGYNAGPHRVKAWRKTSAETLPVDVWIETIPFRETRNYVQAVLAYNVVFGHLQNKTRALLKEGERNALY